MGDDKTRWFREELAAVKPPEKITISDWAGKFRVLGTHSAIRGPYQLEMVPFFIPILNAGQDPEIDEIVLSKPSQIGGTDAVLNILGFYVDQDPSPCLLVLSDERTAKYVSSARIAPMFRDSHHLSRLYDRNEFTKTEINFPNGAYIAVVWASSVAQLATRAIRIVYFDEIDKPGYGVATKEGDALFLGRQRTETFPQGYRKLIYSSTPTYETGNITTELESCDAIFDFHVPCPECGQMQPLGWSAEYLHGFEDGMYRGEDGTSHKFGGIVWEGGREATKKQIDETSGYACGECGSIWNTQQKNEAVRVGRMVPRSELNGYERKIGFHLNRIYSLFDGGRIERLIEEWIRIFKLSGVKRRKALQGFVNSALAEPWKQVVAQYTATKVLRARCDLQPQTVPETTVALTAGVDVQLRGFWFVVRAWASDYTSWLVHYGFLQAWEDVENLLFETRYPVIGKDLKLGIWRAAIDTGGGKGEFDVFSMTESTYFWIRQNSIGRGCRVWGTKGSSRPLQGKLHVGKPLDRTPSGHAIPGGLQIVLLDTEKLKDMVIYRLNQAIEGGDQASYLHAQTDEDYARQITAEEKQVTERGVEAWVQLRPENHLFDCETLCQVCAEPEWMGGGVHLLREISATQDKKINEPQRGKPAGFDWIYGGVRNRPGHWIEPEGR